MNINRNNYEEYFLLYVDNELSAAGKSMVEVFISENPDLQEELLMLQQTIIRPDELSFLNKESLLQPQPINADTEEKLLLLLDNELPAKEKEQLLSVTESDATIKSAWQLLQQTTLSPADTIVFEDKASLYKKEERRVIPMRWWQLAAAAMLIGFGLWGTVSYLNHNSQPRISSTTATTKGTANPATDINTPAIATVKDTVPAIVETNNDNNTAATTIQNRQNKTGAVKTQVTTTADNGNQTTVLPGEKDNNVIVQQQNNEEQKPDFKNLNNNGSNIPATANVTTETGKIVIPDTNTQPANAYAINTSAAGNDENNYTTFDEDENDKPKKSKLGAFFKRVKRTFERKTKIKTGSSDDVKIANMSFAMH